MRNSGVPFHMQRRSSLPRTRGPRRCKEGFWPQAKADAVIRLWAAFRCPRRCKAVLARSQTAADIRLWALFPEGKCPQPSLRPFSPNRRKESFWPRPKPTQTTGFGRLISRREMSAAGNRREKADDSGRNGRNRHGESKRPRKTHREGRSRRTRLSSPRSPQRRQAPGSRSLSGVGGLLETPVRRRRTGAERSGGPFPEA